MFLFWKEKWTLEKLLLTEVFVSLSFDAWTPPFCGQPDVRQFYSFTSQFLFSAIWRERRYFKANSISIAIYFLTFLSDTATLIVAKCAKKCASSTVAVYRLPPEAHLKSFMLHGIEFLICGLKELQALNLYNLSLIPDKVYVPRGPLRKKKAPFRFQR